MGSGGQTPHRQQPPFLLFSPLPTPPPFHHLAPPAISAMPGTPIIPNTPTLPVTPIIPNAPALPGTPTVMLRYPGHSISFSQILSRMMKDATHETLSYNNFLKLVSSENDN